MKKKTDHAGEIVKQAYKRKESQNIGKDDEVVSIRIDAKEAYMLTALSGFFDISKNEIIKNLMSKHIFDMLTALKKEDFDDIIRQFRKEISGHESIDSDHPKNAYDMLYSEGILEIVF
jgi:CTP:phosphocholine cytidylyltransferase-like protein